MAGKPAKKQLPGAPQRPPPSAQRWPRCLSSAPGPQALDAHGSECPRKGWQLLLCETSGESVSFVLFEIALAVLGLAFPEAFVEPACQFLGGRKSCLDFDRCCRGERSGWGEPTCRHFRSDSRVRALQFLAWGRSRFVQLRSVFPCRRWRRVARSNFRPRQRAGTCSGCERRPPLTRLATAPSAAPTPPPWSHERLSSPVTHGCRRGSGQPRPAVALGPCSALECRGARCWAFRGALPQAAGAPFCPEFAEASCCGWALGLVKGFFLHLLSTWLLLVLMCVLG